MAKFDLKNIGAKFGKNLSLLFFMGFIILAVFEALEVNASMKLILKSKQPSPKPPSDKSIRINFENYNDVVNRIQNGDDYKPTGGINRDPFNIGVPTDSPAPGTPPAPGSTNSGGLLQLP